MCMSEDVRGVCKQADASDSNLAESLIVRACVCTCLQVGFPGNGVPANNLGSVYFDQQLLNDALALFQVALPQALPFKSGVRYPTTANPTHQPLPTRNLSSRGHGFRPCPRGHGLVSIGLKSIH
jgi:hypothetical protein